MSSVLSRAVSSSPALTTSARSRLRRCRRAITSPLPRATARRSAATWATCRAVASPAGSAEPELQHADQPVPEDDRGQDDAVQAPVVQQALRVRRHPVFGGEHGGPPRRHRLRGSGEVVQAPGASVRRRGCRRRRREDTASRRRPRRGTRCRRQVRGAPAAPAASSARGSRGPCPESALRVLRSGRRAAPRDGRGRRRARRRARGLRPPTRRSSRRRGGRGRAAASPPGPRLGRGGEPPGAP